jgi:hypothetical protein
MNKIEFVEFFLFSIDFEMVRIVGSEEADFGRESYALFFFLSIFQGARKGAFRRVSIIQVR